MTSSDLDLISRLFKGTNAIKVIDEFLVTYGLASS